MTPAITVKNPARILWLLLGLLVVGFAGMLLWVWPRSTRPHVVARVVAPDGTEVRVIQKNKHEFQCLNTGIYVRERGGWW